MLAVALTGCTAQPAKEHGQLSVKGTQLVDANGKHVMLRGMSYGWSSFWPRFYNAGSVKWLKDDWNCNVVRAAMGVEVGSEGKTYKENPAFAKKCVTDVVDAAIAEGIYVIIDWHSHNINLAEAKTFFAEMSKKYGDKPNVIYEIFNEPDEETWPEVKAYSEEIIKVIRQNDPDNIILVGCPHWDQDINLPAADPIKGTNLMYTVHFYAATHKQELRDRTDAAIKKGLPIFVSECAGMEATGDGPLNPEEWQKWIDWMESRGLSWVTWSVSDKDETCSVLKPTAASTGNWKDADLKESGLKTRAYLRKLNK
ncbi:glycosyl hydrolase family 5 [Flavobacterium akiainvivens]|uniref:Glycosyl hydrolase family 5 n=1 Tax=Flavobacterium akiainvivens TaxID=1202724 RepID=A0A0M9VJY3_9FLAO|nr:glycosyl hydrolase family 5 [Flavobacterium akiainvivens]